jgi:peptidoglycan/xylan/chitin deacetylase (PgdA/CDA1 family)
MRSILYYGKRSSLKYQRVNKHCRRGALTEDDLEISWAQTELERQAAHLACIGCPWSSAPAVRTAQKPKLNLSSRTGGFLRSRRHLKGCVQQAVRAGHLVLLRRRLPEKMSIYFHSAAGHEQRIAELVGFLSDQGYSYVKPGAFLSTKGKAAFLSFDDNYRSWLRLLPIFDRHRIHTTFYVNSWPFRDRVSTVDVERYMAILRSEEETTLSTDELKEIAAAGHTIGAHTHTHPVLTALGPNAAREEIRVSKTELERILQQPVEHFAYPFGMRRHFSEPLRSYCRSIGFATIANAVPALQYARSQPDSLNRSLWLLDQPFAFNLDNLRVDGRLFHLLTGRSPVGGVSGDSDQQYAWG